MYCSLTVIFFLPLPNLSFPISLSFFVCFLTTAPRAAGIFDASDHLRE
jgi:hypothetical protein